MSGKILFVVGRGRSGTWLMQSVLNAHKDICVAPESTFILNLYGKYKNHEWDKKSIVDFTRDLFRDEKIRYWWKLNPTEVQSFLLEMQPKNFQEACLAIYQIYALRQKGRKDIIIADKNPEYARNLPLLSKIFPESRFLVLMRDPRANILSFQRVKFDLSNPAALAIRWRRYSRQIIRASDRLTDQMQIVKYETLLLDPSRTLTQIGEFVGVAGVAGLQESFFKSSKNVYSFNKKIQEPFDASRINEWREGLASDEIKVINYITWKEQRYFGYQFDGLLSPYVRPSMILGIVQAKFVNWLEWAYFKIPLDLKMTAIRIYRSKTGVLEKDKN